jgi:hypothetical protein
MFHIFSASVVNGSDKLSSHHCPSGENISQCQTDKKQEWTHYRHTCGGKMTNVSGMEPQPSRPQSLH